MPYLEYISDQDLESAVSKVVSKALAAISKTTKSLSDNAIDPFSATFDAMTSNISLEEWLNKESSRQTQKTLQNAIGGFHEEILGSIEGWRYINNVVDIVNEDRKIIAEIKNKHNTTKGSDKKTLYDNLQNQLNGKYKGFTGYYVEIIPKNRKTYNHVFTPPDNMTKHNRLPNELIRVIDGKSFYDLASGTDEALHKLYEVLPQVIKAVTDNKIEDKVSASDLHAALFGQAYNTY